MRLAESREGGCPIPPFQYESKSIGIAPEHVNVPIAGKPIYDGRALHRVRSDYRRRAALILREAFLDSIAAVPVINGRNQALAFFRYLCQWASTLHLNDQINPDCNLLFLTKLVFYRLREESNTLPDQ